jgi:hypothetical protein
MTDAELLLGTWIMEGEEEIRTAEFHADGTLNYSIDVAGRTIALYLRWRIDNGVLVTDNDLRSGYDFLDADTLVLRTEEEAFTFRRHGSA